jgi:hypothetical protein
MGWISLGLFNSAEEHFTRIGRCHRCLESDAVLVQRHHRWFAIQILKLGKDVKDGHGGAPPGEGMIVGDLKLCSNISIEHPEAHLLNIFVR